MTRPARSSAAAGKRPTGHVDGSSRPTTWMTSGKLLIVFALAGLAVIITHWSTLDSKALTIDDDEYLVNNQMVRNPSWPHAGRFLGEVFTPSTVRGYYQPLTMISLMLDSARGGTPDNPRPFHETSLALHVMNVWLIILILYLLFGRLEVAAAVGLIFGIHPMTVEPIAWVGDRKTTLAAFFGLWSILLYVVYARASSPSPGGQTSSDGRRSLPAGQHATTKQPASRVFPASLYGLCLLAYMLALMSKPTSTLLPGAMLLMDFWPLGRLRWRSLVEKVPFGIIAVVSSVVTVVSQGRTAAVGLPSTGSTMPIVLGFCHNTIFYLGKMIWPVNLTSLYAKPEPMSLANPLLLAMLAGSILLAVALVISLKWTRGLLTGWLIFLCIILPTMGGIGFTVVIASDKYAYLPAIGLLMTLCWALGLGYDQLRGRWGAAGAGASLAGLVLLLAGLEFAGVQRYVPSWKDTLTIETYMAAHAPKTPLIHYNLGLTYAGMRDWPRSIEQFEQTVSLDPGYVRAYNNLGVVMMRLNRLPEAIRYLDRALLVDPGFALARDNLAKTYNRLGLNRAAEGKTAEALGFFRKASRFAPDWPEPPANAARLLSTATASGPSDSR